MHYRRAHILAWLLAVLAAVTGCSKEDEEPRCRVGSKTFKPGSMGPSPDCGVCRPEVSTTSLAPSPDHCGVEGACATAGTLDTSGCRVCDPTRSKGWTVLEGRCFIDGQCVLAGQTTATCHECRPEVSQEHWTLAEGWCEINKVCVKAGDATGPCHECRPEVSPSIASTMDGHCVIDNFCLADGDSSSSGCFTCDSALTQTEWSPMPDTCFVNTKCFDKGPIPGSPCMQCDPAVDRTRVMRFPNHCLIGSSCIPGQTIPAWNECVICDPAADDSQWSGLPDGTPCGGGTAECHNGACSVAVTGGTFTMGAPFGQGDGTEQPPHVVTVAPFRLDRSEVRGGEFLDFFESVNGQCCVKDKGCASCWSGTGKASAVASPDVAAQEVTWYGASAFCEARGRRLPTEAEWERAANGPGGCAGDSGRPFPWGDACVCDAASGSVLCDDAAWPGGEALANCAPPGCKDAFEGAAPPGSMPGDVSYEGALDLAGNVAEWTQDCWHKTYDGAPADASAWLADCDDSSPRVVRGGSFASSPSQLRRTRRVSRPVTEGPLHVGFRCATDCPECAPAPEAGCDDGLACTVEQCTDGGCANVPLPGTCLIEGCRAAGEAAPTDACLRCDPATSTTAWSPAPDGTPCGIGAACREGACMAAIAAGAFPMGDSTPIAAPQHAVLVAAFELDRFEVTRDEFVRFVDDVGGACEFEDATHPCSACPNLAGCPIEPSEMCECAGSGGQGLAGCRRHPVTNATWYGARAYCEARGARLPTEAEWERAAGGPAGPDGTSHRRYPWGDDAGDLDERANCQAKGYAESAICAPDCALEACAWAGCGDPYAKTASVGSFPQGGSAEGVLDLAGNAAEWTEDCFAVGYAGAPVDGTARTAGCDTAARVQRGLPAWEPDLRTTARAPALPELGAGFRCARSIDGPTCAGGCDDAVACTDDVCTSAGCVHLGRPGICAIGGACIAAGDLDPTNPCRACVPDASVATWTSRPDGSACGEGKACHDAVCEAIDPEPGMAILPTALVMLDAEGATGVNVAAFRLDRSEVSAADFAAFLSAHGNTCSDAGAACYACAAGAGPIDCNGVWDVRTTCQAAADAPSTSPCADHPAARVTWYGASAYCASIGKRLPTEAEWARAAIGPAGWRRYPWGDTWSGACAAEGVQGEDQCICKAAAWTPSTARASCAKASCGDGFEGTAPLGALWSGDTVDGLHDLAGNVSEWTADCWTGAVQATPPQGPCAAELRVVRGGGYTSPSGDLRTDHREKAAAASTFSDLGFRCARSIF